MDIDRILASVELPNETKMKLRSALDDARREHDVNLKAAKDDGDRLWCVLQSNIITSAARAAIEKHGGKPALLMPLIAGRTKVDRDTLAVTVTRDDGSIDQKIVKQDLVPISIDEFVGKLKSVEDYAPAFSKPAAPPPAAATPRYGHAALTPISAGSNPWAKETFNLTKQMQLQKADPGRAAALRHAAGG